MHELKYINNDFESYQEMISFFSRHNEQYFSDVNISLKNWFAANMSAALGAVLDKFQEKLNQVFFVEIEPAIEKILTKNKFLSHFGFPDIEDKNHTTIPYLKLQPSDGRFFNNYIFKELLNKPELPAMSNPAKNKIAECIYEIFVNAQIHSKTETIYTCGQFFPQKSEIEFSIVDVGIGFKKSIFNRFGADIDSGQAIRWATKDRNTTKNDSPGGIGLALLKEFIQKNKGKMQIISYDGFYEFDEIGETIRSFDGEFPGTIVNLKFRTNDDSSYRLIEEVNEDGIF
jgi:light-regulated signal transduction histidine kinase (bacteriophytochrome)